MEIKVMLPALSWWLATGGHVAVTVKVALGRRQFPLTAENKRFTLLEKKISGTDLALVRNHSPDGKSVEM